jgi:hypothetical protein
VQGIGRLVEPRQRCVAVSASWRVRSKVFCASTTTDSKRTLIDRLIESL